MKKEKSLTRRKGEPYPLEIRLAAIGEYRLGVSRKEIAFKYSISDPTVISHWIRKFEAKRWPCPLPLGRSPADEFGCEKPPVL